MQSLIIQRKLIIAALATSFLALPLGCSSDDSGGAAAAGAGNGGSSGHGGSAGSASGGKATGGAQNTGGATADGGSAGTTSGGAGGGATSAGTGGINVAGGNAAGGESGGTAAGGESGEAAVGGESGESGAGGEAGAAATPSFHDYAAEKCATIASLDCSHTNMPVQDAADCTSDLEGDQDFLPPACQPESKAETACEAALHASDFSCSTDSGDPPYQAYVNANQCATQSAALMTCLINAS